VEEQLAVAQAKRSPAEAPESAKVRIGERTEHRTNLVDRHPDAQTPYDRLPRRVRKFPNSGHRAGRHRRR
jgi:hypothetical protein